MIQVRNLTKSYATQSGRHYVFRNVNVDFPSNANIGILGPNGAGKSTLLRILGGIDFPDTGTITSDKSMSWPLGLRGGFVGNLTGRENCRIVCTIYGLKSREISQKLEFIKELSGIGHYFEEPIKYYSSGMGSRIGFALSMAFDFDYLLIDEITSVGDRKFRDVAKQALDEKRDRSKVIMVSHSMGSIRDFCEIGVLVKDGEISVFKDLDSAVRAYLPQEKSDKKTDLKTESSAKVVILNTKGSSELEVLTDELTGLLTELESALEAGVGVSNESRFFHILGNVYARLGASKHAITHHQKAIDFEPDKAHYYPPLINILLSTGQISEAEKTVTRALAWWPDNAVLRSAMAQVRVHQARFDEAVSLLKSVVEENPDNLGSRNALANAAGKSGDHELALKQYMVVIEVAPDRIAPYREAAKHLVELGHTKEAISMHVQAENILNRSLPKGAKTPPSPTEGMLKNLRIQIEHARDLLDV